MQKPAMAPRISRLVFESIPICILPSCPLQPETATSAHLSNLFSKPRSFESSIVMRIDLSNARITLQQTQREIQPSPYLICWILGVLSPTICSDLWQF